jgi:hypothetical protein
MERADVDLRTSLLTAELRPTKATLFDGANPYVPVNKAVETNVTAPARNFILIDIKKK